MKKIFFMALAAALFTVFCSVACNSKPAEDPHQAKVDEVNGKMAAAKANYEDTTQKVAAMRAEAAQLRMNGNAEDEAKAAQIEREANQLEQNALNGLNPGF